MANSQIGEVPAHKVLGAISDLTSKLKKGAITWEEFNLFLKRQNPFEVKESKPEQVTTPILPDLNWVEVYQLLGLSSEFDTYCATNPKDLSVDPLTWAVPMIQGVTCRAVITAFRQKGVKVSLYREDLDAFMSHNDRDPSEGSYIVRFKRSIEVEEHFSESAKQLKEEGVESITLLERLLLGLAYFLATGDQLDQKTLTLCAGSRSSGGDVPCVCWNPEYRALYVGWYDVRYRRSSTGTRAAVR